MKRYYLNTSHAEIAKGCAEFAAQFARLEGKSPDPVLVLDLVAQARLLTRISIDECNGIIPTGKRYAAWDNDDQDFADVARKIAEIHITADVVALFGAGATIEFQRDPRGVSVKINDTYFVDGGYQ